MLINIIRIKRVWVWCIFSMQLVQRVIANKKVPHTELHFFIRPSEISTCNILGPLTTTKTFNVTLKNHFSPGWSGRSSISLWPTYDLKIATIKLGV